MALPHSKFIFLGNLIQENVVRSFTNLTFKLEASIYLENLELFGNIEDIFGPSSSPFYLIQNIAKPIKPGSPLFIPKEFIFRYENEAIEDEESCESEDSYLNKSI